MSRHTIRRFPRPSAPSVPPPRGRVPAFIASSMVKPRAGMTDAEARTQMAEDMREAGQREGGITVDGLRLLGFTDSQITRLADSARVWAQALSGATA